MKRHIPNALTLGNLLSGMGGIWLCLVWQDLYAAAWCVVLAAMFDVADGAVARALGVSSPIGKDLDSLADGVTFGVLPSFLMMMALRLLGYDEAWWTFLPALLGVCAVLRLAKFNNDPGQARHFSGLPSPAAGLAIVGLAMQAANQDPAQVHPFVTAPGIVVSSIAVALLMVSPFRLISFKLGLKPTLPYWLGITAVALASLPWTQGGFTLVGTAAYVVASQVYFRLNPPPPTHA